MSQITHVTIVGAGAMGCLFAANLGENGVGVTLVDTDSDRLAVIGAQGITIDDDRGRRVVRVGAATAADAGPTDLVMLFTKGMHSREAIRSVAHLADGKAHAITLQNGLGNAEEIAQIFAPDHILIGATDLPADLSPPTLVSSHGTGQIWLGAYAGVQHEIADRVADLFRLAGLPATHDETVLVSIWEKVAFNAALNPVAALTRSTVAGLDCPAGREIAFAVVGETVVAAAANGIIIDPVGIKAKIEHALAHQREHKASMLQDIEAGRRSEIETINGAIVRAAEAKGVETPITRTLANLVRMIDRPAT